MRQRIIAGNWKMHMTCGAAAELVKELATHLDGGTDVEIVVCPPFTALQTVRDALRSSSSVSLGAQNVFWKEKGAYTGQIAPHMLADLGVTHVIVGHSETRGRFGVAEPDFDEAVLRHFGDSDATVNRKIKAVLAAGMTPICCVGETIGERRDGRTDEVVRSQTEAALAGVSKKDDGGRMADESGSSIIRHPSSFPVVFAYEPVWAIGTGEVCGAEEADRVCGVIRETVGGLYGTEAAEAVRIQYGGSMKPDNAAELLAKPNIDGGLIGGASLKAADFVAIINA